MESFQTPIHRSLTQPVLLGGAPREFAVLNGAAAACLILAFHSWLGVPLGLVIHSAGVALAKHDPYFLQTVKRHIDHKPFYDV